MDRLTEKELNRVKSIEEKWDEHRENYCKVCMYEAIRHWDRNMSPACDELDENEHPDRHDGEIFAEAPEDIWVLINIINKLTGRAYDSSYESDDSSSTSEK